MSAMLTRRKVAVIGGGPAGLIATKQLMDAGITAKVFSNSLCGMWNTEVNPFWPAMRTNLSKFTCRFSDQPWPNAAPIFPSQHEMEGYLQQYASKHLKPENVVLRCTVTGLHSTGDGMYSLTWEDGVRHSSTELFDDVVIASGFFSKPVMPRGLEDFKGNVLHSSEYTSPHSFAGRRVVVAGASFSSAEIAADVATTAASVINILPRPSWIIPRYLPLQPDKANTPFLPVDLLFYQMKTGKPAREGLFKGDKDRHKTNIYMQTLIGKDKDDVLHEMRVLEKQSVPEGVVPSVHASISDTYANVVKAGIVEPFFGYVRSVAGNTVHIAPSKSSPPTATVENVDDVIFCTGFTPALQYLDESLQEKIGLSDDTLQPIILHRDVLHPDLPGLYFVGMYRGPYFAVVELQARAVAGYISGSLPIPSEENMREGVKTSEQIRDQVPRPQFPHPDYVGLCFDWMQELSIPLPDSVEGLAFSPTTILSEKDKAVDPSADCGAEIMRCLEDCYAGKYMAPIIFRALQGEWNFQRQLTSRLEIAPSGTVVGTISLSRHSRASGDLVYNEKGTFTTAKGLVIDVSGSQYVYELNEESDCIDIYFADKASGRTKERIFVSLKVVSRQEDGWVAVGEPHLCGEDTYKVAFKLAFEGLSLSSVEISIDVIGPFKDYTSFTTLRRFAVSSP